MKKVLSIRIPTILAFLILIVGVGASTFLAQNVSVIESNASSDKTPQDVKITNVTDSSFTISYKTAVPALGSISYGTTNTLGTIVPDDRDSISGSPNKYFMHYFTIMNLRPNTEYLFSILSGDKVYLQENTPFRIRTGETITMQAPDMPQYTGLVAIPEGTTATDVVVYLQSDTTQAVSALLRSDTSYILSLSNIRTPDLTSYVKLLPDEEIQMSIVAPNSSSHVKISANQESPLPLILLSRVYDFTFSPPTPTTQPTASDAASFPVPSGTQQSVRGARTLPNPTKPFTNTVISPTLMPKLFPTGPIAPL